MSISALTVTMQGAIAGPGSACKLKDDDSSGQRLIQLKFNRKIYWINWHSPDPGICHYLHMGHFHPIQMEEAMN